MSLWSGLTTNRAATEPDAVDERLCSPRYALPFADVWATVLEVAASLPRWTIVATDPQAGELNAVARTRLWNFVDDVRIRVSLDESGLTRVDVHSGSRVGRADFGTNRRRIARFLATLEHYLSASSSERGSMTAAVRNTANRSRTSYE